MVHLIQYSIIILFLLSSHTRGVESIRKCAFLLPSSPSSVRRPRRSVWVPIPKAAADRSPQRLIVRGGSPPNTPIDSTTDNDSSSSSSSFALWQELLAELFGTFLIVQMGTASMMAARFLNAPAAGAYIPLVWAAAVALAIAVTAPISGAHLNPAITLALSLVRPRQSKNKHGWSTAAKVLLYSAAQFVGAILASATNLLLFGPAMRQYELAHGLVRSSLQAIPTASVFGEYYTTSIPHACLVEVLGTALLSTVIFALTHPRRRSAASFSPAPWIGATVGVVICTLSPFTQAGLNPARDLGPRLVAFWGGWTALATQPRGFWVVYGVGPLVGALLGALWVDRVLYRTTTTRRSKKS